MFLCIFYVYLKKLLQNEQQNISCSSALKLHQQIKYSTKNTEWRTHACEYTRIGYQPLCSRMVAHGVHGKQRALCIPVIVFIVQFILLFLYSSYACHTIIVVVTTIIITIMLVFVAISVPLSFACTFTHHL